MTKKAIDALMSIGIDIGKDTFHLVGFDFYDQLVLRKKIKRLALLRTFEKHPKMRCRHGSVPERSLCQSILTQVGI